MRFRQYAEKLRLLIIPVCCATYLFSDSWKCIQHADAIFFLSQTMRKKNSIFYEIFTFCASPLFSAEKKIRKKYFAFDDI